MAEEGKCLGWPGSLVKGMMGITGATWEDERPGSIKDGGCEEDGVGSGPLLYGGTLRDVYCREKGAVAACPW